MKIDQVIKYITVILVVSMVLAFSRDTVIAGNTLEGRVALDAATFASDPTSGTQIGEGPINDAESRDVAARFDFALIGDIPRIGDPALEPNLEPFLRLRDEINGTKGIRFVIHDGDYKTGGSECSDENMNRWYELCNSFSDPFVFIVGDNEWTDCHREKCGGYDPEERLEALREKFYSTPYALGIRGNKLYLERQSNTAGNERFEVFSENFRWTYKSVMFVGLNVQGSNNNYPTGGVGDLEEFILRNEACNEFLRKSFSLATENSNSGIMIIIQASLPQFERNSNAPREGFEDFLETLIEETVAFKKPVVLVHGDSHYFRVDKPMYDSNGRRIENFTRVETFGAPDVHWVHVMVNSRNPELFSFRQKIVEENLVER